MKVKQPVIGGICKSIQGRDKDRHYIIKEVLSEGFVNVVDGNYRKISSPKRKNIKHLKLMPYTAELIATKLSSGKQVFDTEIYSALKEYNALSDAFGETYAEADNITLKNEEN